MSGLILKAPFDLQGAQCDFKRVRFDVKNDLHTKTVLVVTVFSLSASISGFTIPLSTFVLSLL